MKGALITEKNYNQVCGRLRKFFSHYEYLVWHTFDSGFKKRNPTMCYFSTDHKKHCVASQYHVGARWTYTFNKPNNKMLAVKYGRSLAEGGFIIEPGMTVWFLGNRITIKKEASALLEYRWIYTTFQIANPEQIAIMRDGGM